MLKVKLGQAMRKAGLTMNLKKMMDKSQLCSCGREDLGLHTVGYCQALKLSECKDPQCPSCQNLE